MALSFRTTLSVLLRLVQFVPLPLFHFLSYPRNVGSVSPATTSHPSHTQIEPSLNVSVHRLALIPVDPPQLDFVALAAVGVDYERNGISPVLVDTGDERLDEAGGHAVHPHRHQLRWVHVIAVARRLLEVLPVSEGLPVLLQTGNCYTDI
jgi:hypothetical protein